MGRIYGHVAELVSELSDRARVTVEIGCGSGQYRPWVHGGYLGIDLEEHYPGGRADVKADARALPLRDGTTDLVFMVAALFLLPQSDMAFVEAGRVLRPGGRLAIFDYSWWRARRGRVNWHTSRSLAGRLRRLGYIPRIHWCCAPAWGHGVVRRVSLTHPLRLLTYLASDWVVVSGTKVG